MHKFDNTQCITVKLCNNQDISFRYFNALSNGREKTPIWNVDLKSMMGWMLLMVILNMLLCIWKLYQDAIKNLFILYLSSKEAPGVQGSSCFRFKSRTRRTTCIKSGKEPATKAISGDGPLCKSIAPFSRWSILIPILLDPYIHECWLSVLCLQ